MRIVVLLMLLSFPLLALLPCPRPAAAAPEGGGAATTDPSVAALESRFGAGSEGYVIVVRIDEQSLALYRHGKEINRWAVSTSEFGIGSTANSMRTPTGVHRVARKIGNGAPLGTIFKGRRNTGRIATIYTDDTPAEEDYVTTRILWLEGLEPGVNKGEGIDSFKRYIYIHGTPEEGRIGRPASHGCIRMRNTAVVELFDRVPVGTLVDIRKE